MKQKLMPKSLSAVKNLKISRFTCTSHLCCLVRPVKHGVQGITLEHSLQAGKKAERARCAPDFQGGLSVGVQITYFRSVSCTHILWNATINKSEQPPAKVHHYFMKVTWIMYSICCYGTVLRHVSMQRILVIWSLFFWQSSHLSPACHLVTVTF